MQEPNETDLNSNATAGAALGGSSAQVPREEMRRRRLAALGQAEASTEQPASITATDSFTTPPRPTARNSVIDLCDTDDDEQHKPAARYPSSSDDDSIDLVAAFTAQQARDARSLSSKQDAESSSHPSKTASRKHPAAALVSKQDVSITNFQIASYNLWFQSVHPTERMQAIFEILLQCHQPDNPLVMVGFQEVIPPLASVLFPALERQGYTILRQPVGFVPYGCAMAIRTDMVSIIESGFRPFQHTNMDRGTLYARVQLSWSREVLFTTTHLESWAGEEHPGSAQRQRQILEMEAFCVQTVAKHPSVQCAVITGDLNWDDERARSAGPDPEMLGHLKKKMDGCLETLAWFKQKAIGYTYDAKLNPMLGGNLRRRFDRILLYPGNAFHVQSIDFLGKEALPGLSWSKTNPYNNSVRSVPVAPSDHFGLLAQLKLDDSA